MKVVLSRTTSAQKQAVKIELFDSGIGMTKETQAVSSSVSVKQIHRQHVNMVGLG
ncbi:hypothetical protein [Pseudoalteromonas luteoviolacea]|uniref:Uncharacterized protein n=1 Tax=Pseudoalteromonas luteoviolacea NCIMB 1942 TaxID=1365253 RepID=A0A161ZTF0_9GAMM|nr:hypothetical protein [Pseudoalteromonas luteoviolacea]KZN45468.1 hypothetical protein N482_14610 [Pseudoalteromonas luteoviolacea NCIMB 1942]